MGSFRWTSKHCDNVQRETSFEPYASECRLVFVQRAGTFIENTVIILKENLLAWRLHSPRIACGGNYLPRFAEHAHDQKPIQTQIFIQFAWMPVHPCDEAYRLSVEQSPWLLDLAEDVYRDR